MARKLGGATVIGVAVGANGALTLFTPLAARMHVGMFITLRVAIGLTQVRTGGDACSKVNNNFLLTELEGRTGEYWPGVLAIRT